MSEVIRWTPVTPALTHFHSFVSLEFDLGEDRGTATWGAPLPELPDPHPSPWQTVVLTMLGIPRREPDLQPVPVSCTFSGVVNFQFLQDDFAPKTTTDEASRNRYDVRTLRGAGYADRGEDENCYGAFCLWESKDSPLLRKLAGRWDPWPHRPPDERQQWFRHYQTSCDELGTFELVACGVIVERLASTTGAP